KGSAYRNAPVADPVDRGWLPHFQGWWSCGRCARRIPVPSCAMETPDQGTPALRLRGVRKTFEAADEDQVPVRALRGIDLEIAPAAFGAIMGPSGCGKSTLLNLVAGLDAPSDGEIDIAGEPIAGLSDDDLALMRRRHIGIVFQFFNLLEGMTVRENVALPAVV